MHTAVQVAAGEGVWKGCVLPPTQSMKAFTKFMFEEYKKMTSFSIVQTVDW